MVWGTNIFQCYLKFQNIDNFLNVQIRRLVELILVHRHNKACCGHKNTEVLYELIWSILNVQSKKEKANFRRINVYMHFYVYTYNPHTYICMAGVQLRIGKCFTLEVNYIKHLLCCWSNWDSEIHSDLTAIPSTTQHKQPWNELGEC